MAIVNVGKLQYSGSVTPIEEQETIDDSGAVFRGLHSEVGEIIGGNIEKTLNSVTALSFDSELVTTAAAVDVDFSAGDYDGLTGNGATDIDFLFVRIKRANSTGTPNCTVEIAGADLIYLSGVGDYCLIPLLSYDNTSARIAVKSSAASTTAVITVLIAKW